MEDMTANTTREPSDLEWLLQKVEVIRAAWKLVLVSFLTLGIFGCAALYGYDSARQVYSSHMVLPLTPNLQALIYTDAILGPVVRKIRSVSEPDVSEERQRLASRLVVSELKKGAGLFSISVTDHSPQAAQAILAQVLTQIVVASKPSGTALANAQRRMESEKRALTELKELSAVFRENASRARAGNEGEQYARSFVILVTEIATKEREIWELQNLLDGFKVEDVVVPPSLSPRPDSTGLARGLALILLVSFLLSISFALLRDVWGKRNGSQGNTSNMQRAA